MNSRGSVGLRRGLAEFERELIRARTGEGRARAKARGVKLGRQLPRGDGIRDHEPGAVYARPGEPRVWNRERV
jgi:DNA invertase Pin-like site-specific DNA recombinase